MLGANLIYVLAIELREKKSKEKGKVDLEKIISSGKSSRRLEADSSDELIYNCDRLILFLGAATGFKHERVWKTSL